MNIFPSQNLERFTGCHPTSLANGSKNSDSEPNRGSHQTKPTMNDTLPSDLAHSPAHSFTSGMNQKPLPYSTACVIHEPFTVTSNGSIGQMILDSDGKTVVWATNPWIAQVICKLLTDYTNNENKGL